MLFLPSLCAPGFSVVGLVESYRAHECRTKTSAQPRTHSFLQHHPLSLPGKRRTAAIRIETVRRNKSYLHTVHAFEHIPTKRKPLLCRSRWKGHSRFFGGLLEADIKPKTAQQRVKALSQILAGRKLIRLVLVLKSLFIDAALCLHCSQQCLLGCHCFRWQSQWPRSFCNIQYFFMLQLLLQLQLQFSGHGFWATLLSWSKFRACLRYVNSQIRRMNGYGKFFGNGEVSVGHLWSHSLYSNDNCCKWWRTCHAKRNFRYGRKSLKYCRQFVFLQNVVCKLCQTFQHCIMRVVGNGRSGVVQIEICDESKRSIQLVRTVRYCIVFIGSVFNSALTVQLMMGLHTRCKSLFSHGQFEKSFLY